MTKVIKPTYQKQEALATHLIHIFLNKAFLYRTWLLLLTSGYYCLDFTSFLKTCTNYSIYVKDKLSNLVYIYFVTSAVTPVAILL